MSKEINDLVLHLAKVLTDMNSGTVDIYKLTEAFNDHIERIVQLEQRVALLENKINNQQIDTMPGANKNFLV